MRRRKTRKIFIVLSEILVVIILLIMHIIFNVNPIIKNVSNEEVKALTAIAVNLACDEVFVENYSNDIIKYIQSDDGTLQLVSANTLILNSIARKTIQKTQEKIMSLGEHGVGIPVGSLSGLTILMGQGKKIFVKAYPVGSVSCHFVSEFKAVGINQTKHRVSLIVTAAMNIVMPGMDEPICTDNEVLLIENIIVGKVPEAFLQSTSLDEMLNLVP